MALPQLFLWVSIGLHDLLSLTQSVCPSFSRESVRPHADGSCSFIRLACLCHATAEVRPSSFQVIADRSGLTAILFVSGSYVSFSLFLAPLGLFLCDLMISYVGMLPLVPRNLLGFHNRFLFRGHHKAHIKQLYL